MVEFGEILEVEADLHELESLLLHSQRPRTVQFLNAEIARLKAFLQADAANAEEASNATASAAPAESPAPTPAAKPVLLSRAAAGSAREGRQYVPIDKFAWDQGEYNTPWLTVYITSGVDGVGAVKEGVSCDFGPRSFDLKIHDLNGKSFRMVKDRLDEEINVQKSKVVVKKNAVYIKLHKTKGEESYSSYKTWMNLESKKSKEDEQRTKDDPSAGIMDLMKDMYDSGDDNMKKAIGEAMLKSKSRDPNASMDDDM